MSLATATASSSVSTTRTGAIGAKISSFHSRESRLTPVTTVGRKNGPSLVPPATIRAPAATASSSIRWARSCWRVLIIGPSPTFVGERVAHGDRVGPGGQPGHVALGDAALHDVPARR